MLPEFTIEKNSPMTASTMLQSVTDHKMKVFLTAVSADTIDRDEDWISYVALSLTDVPPMSWNDDQRELFENNLAEMSGKFNRLASMHFADVSGNFVKPSYQITVTHADGSEYNNIISVKPEQEKRIKDVATKIIKDVKTKRFTKKDTEALIAMLSAMAK